MAAPLTMQVSSQIGRLIGSFNNGIGNLIRQRSLAVISTHKLCTQGPSSTEDNVLSSEDTQTQRPLNTSRGFRGGAAYAETFNPHLVRELISQMDGDMPLSEMSDPYKKEYKRCLLCEKNVELEWKNIRLLSQFVSPYTGRIYGRHITGLCIPMQKRVARLIKRARMLGYMSYLHKDPHYLKDPRLFDPFSPSSRN